MTTIADWLSAFAAGGATVIASASLIVSIRTARRDRPHLRVQVSVSYPVMGQEVGEAVVAVEAQNDGRYAEVVNGVVFLAGTKTMYLIDPRNFPEGALPKRIEPGESMTAWIGLDALKTQIAREGLRAPKWAEVRCRSGRRHRGGVPQNVHRD